MAKRIELNDELKKQILELAGKGYIDNEICQSIGIGRTKFYEWLNENTDFLNALKNQKRQIDFQVEQKLLKRAMGFKIKEVIKEVDRNTKTLEVSRITTKEVLPDVTAQIFWLKNRRPQVWRDKQEIENTNINLNISDDVDFSKMTDDEIKEYYNNRRQLIK